MLPASWITQARKSDIELRLTAKLARERARVGRRHLLRAALWRVPLVGLAFWYLIAPAWRARDNAGWSDMRSDGIVVYMVAVKGARTQLRSVSTCANRAKMTDPPLDTLSSNDCDNLACESFALFPLHRGEALHLVRMGPGLVGVRIAIADRSFLGGGAGWTDFGEVITNQNLPGTELVQPIAVSGWYQVQLVTRSREAVGVQPCVD